MSFLSRFLKPKNEESILEGIEEPLEEEEEEGLLMSAGSESGGARRESESPNLGASLSPEPQRPDEALTDQAGALPEVVDDESLAGADATDPTGASVAQETLDTSGIEVQRISLSGEGSSDPTADLFSAFRDTGLTSETHQLAKGLEDIPMEDLLAGLREVRAWLPPARPARGDGEPAGGGQR